MLANFFGKSKPVNFITITILFFVYSCLNLFLNNSAIFEVKILLNYLIILLGFLGVFFLYEFIIVKNKLTFDNTYAFLIFVISLGFLDLNTINYWEIIEVILALLFFRKIYSLRAEKSIFEKLYDSSFLLGLLFLIAEQNLFYLIMIYSAIILFIKITSRTIIIPLLGLLTVIILFFTYYFFIDKLSVFYDFFELNFKIGEKLSNTILISVFGFLTILSLLLKSKDIFSISNTFKKSWMLLIIHLFVSITCVLFKEDRADLDFIMILIPSTIIIANWIQTIQNKLIVNVIFILLLFLSFTIHFIA